MASDSFQTEVEQSLEQAFPPADPQTRPLGPRVLVQLRRTSNKTKSGLILVEETKETVKWNNQVAKVISLGPLAFKNREDASDWPEGMWVKPGDFIRCPRWGGDRIEVAVKDGDPIIFVIFNDHEIIGQVTGNPLAMKSYIL
jgi:co-chaperonin GroES (HSP10)